MTCLSILLKRYFGEQVPQEQWNVLQQGASGRKIVRIPLSNGQTCIGMQWNTERMDNAAFVSVAQYLRQQGVQVPQVYDFCCERDGGAALVQDLGDVNLAILQKQSWTERRRVYIESMRQIHKLHTCPVPTTFALQPSFDKTLYRWEQEYFAKHFLHTHVGLPSDSFLQNPLLEELTTWLSTLPLQPIHRDCQSQNIHFFENRAWLIDFQGMRLGRAEYDVAALVFDAYARLNSRQITELLYDWQSICNIPLDGDIFYACALQRLMQMLGAFANIGYNMNKTWYLEQIPWTWEHLLEVSACSPFGKIFKSLRTLNIR